MPSVSFENLTSRLPKERKALYRLKALLDEADANAPSTRPLEFTFEHLFEETGFIRPEDLALVLAELVSKGAIEKTVRVYSPFTGGGIADFDSLTEVPQTLHDWRADQDIDVRPNSVSVIYRLPHHGRSRR